ncbi:MAG: hypothetical protein PHT84_03560, partial [Candidatus Pacebacteria bacterium]|nr:hypothetical protein [Candidatus Paceibacterota bacterium]
NTHNVNGQLILSVQRGGITNEYAYDDAGRRTHVVLNGATVSSTAYDAIGRTVWTRNADGVVVSNTYDSADRLHRVYMPDGTFTENVYSNGWLWKTIDRAGRTNVMERDAVGRLVQTIDPSGGTVQYRHDASGNLTNLVDQAGNNTFWTYDAEGRQTRKTYADASHWDYTYDAAGRLTSRTDAKSQVTYYEYDAVGNLTNINYPNDADVSFTYDALNRKTTMTDGIGSTTYAYSSCCGLLEAEDGPFANDTLYFGYTDAKQLASVTSSFLNVQYAYDDLQRLHTVVGPEGTNTYSYEGAGTAWRDLQLGNGTAASRQYDELMRLTNMVNATDAGVLSSFALTVDDADQRTQVIREDGRIIQYQYDPIGQLTNAYSGSYAYSYQYDTTGNPLEQNKSGMVYSNSFNNLNQNIDTVFSGGLAAWGTQSGPLAATVTVNAIIAHPWGSYWVATNIPFTQGANTLQAVIQDAAGRKATNTITVVAQNKTYAYDANGNMTANGTFTYVWDDENRLTEVWKEGVVIQRNKYDGLGRRREKVEGFTTNRYIYKDWLVLAVVDGADNLLETYTHGADLSGQIGGNAGGIGGILADTSATNSHFYHYDFNGNIIQLTDATATPVGCIEYSPYGEVLLKSGLFTPRHQFSTKEYDCHTGLNYYGYRFYLPNLGRWPNRDPIEERGGANLYTYVYNNIENMWDYMGNDPRGSGIVITVPIIYECSGAVCRICYSQKKSCANQCGIYSGTGKTDKEARKAAENNALADLPGCEECCNDSGVKSWLDCRPK